MQRMERHEDWCERREQLWTQRWKDSDVAAESARVRIYEKMDTMATKMDERVERIAKEQREAINKAMWRIIGALGAGGSAMLWGLLKLMHDGHL